ncbi:MAG: hypothetical protein O7G83_03415 [Proteobacteria bacterium]|nr:hypothetical protein [Pseudomonadota bacterium]
MWRREMLVVFLNNKLITSDTIAPMMLELKERYPAMDIRFYCFDQETYEIIRRNEIVFDALERAGRLAVFKGASGNSVFGKAVAVLNLARFAWLGLFGRATFLHFRALNEMPLKILSRINRRRTFMCQGSTLALSATEAEIDKVTSLNRRARMIEPTAVGLIGFDANWPYFTEAVAAGLPQFLVTPPFKRPAWRHYLEDRVDRDFGGIGLSSDGRLVTMVLSSMDRSELLANPGDFPVLFEETLRLIAEALPGMPVVVKPHPATPKRDLKRQHEIVERSGNRNVIITELHPMLLATRSICFVGNTFSSTFATAQLLGVPTIEYTHYGAVALKASTGGSMRPDLVDEFINRDPAKMKRTLARLARPGAARRRAEVPASELDARYEHVLDILARA